LAQVPGSPGRLCRGDLRERRAIGGGGVPPRCGTPPPSIPALLRLSTFDRF
jgi:hypothetical protein